MLRDGELLVELTGDPSQTHGQRLPTDLMRALDAARTSVEQIDLLAVAAGPGSFTGLRVGIATVQGLAIARGLQVVPVPALEALAREGARRAPAGASIAPWMDAQRGEVFAALYAPGARAVLAAPSAASAAATLAGWPEIGPPPVVFVGDGALRYREAITGQLGPRAIIVAPTPALAAPVARIAAEQPERAVRPHAVVPIYIRRPDAELARDRRRSGT